VRKKLSPSRRGVLHQHTETIRICLYTNHISHSHLHVANHCHFNYCTLCFSVAVVQRHLPFQNSDLLFKANSLANSFHSTEGLRLPLVTLMLLSTPIQAAMLFCNSLVQTNPSSASTLLTSNDTNIFTLANNRYSYQNTLSTNIRSLNMDSSSNMDRFHSKCCVCLETHPFGNMTDVNEYQVCRDCIRLIFQRALDYEGNYPPKWGKHTLNIRKYTQERILTLKFLGLYHQKEREYRCPPARRVYCSWSRHSRIQEPEDKGEDIGNDKGKAIDDRCNSFLGARVESTVDVLTNDGELVVSCKDCHNLSCRACETHIHSFTHAMTHKCMPVRAADPDDAAFEGLKRGGDFQLCPFQNCERKIELSDGCNHIRCTCGMQFCFICGQPALAGSGHWSKTDGPEPGCPRYNQPGAYALYDNTPVRGLRARNPLSDPNPQPLYATQAIHPASLTLRELNAAQEALDLQRLYDARGSSTARIDQLSHDARVLDIIAEAETTRDEAHYGRRRRRLTILDTTAPAPAQLIGLRGNGHPYHIDPLSDIDVEEDEADARRTQLQHHQRRLQTIRRELERHARRWPGNHAGASRGNSSTPETSMGVARILSPNEEFNSNAGIPMVHFPDNLQARADTPHQDQPSRFPPLFPSPADVRNRRDWSSLLPVPTFTNAPVSALRSRSGLVSGPRAHSAPVSAPLPLRGVASSEDVTNGGRVQEQELMAGSYLTEDTGTESRQG
jgi:hypothetical protein